MSPSLTWDKQFNAIVRKIKEAIRKLNNTEMVTITASMYYNVYLIKNVYYGCGIFSISQKQEEILMKIYKPVILRKLGLSITFPRNVLYARKSVLGVRLISPSTIIDILALKLYVGYNRDKNEVAKTIKILEENA